jgi:hypothetical protein
MTLVLSLACPEYVVHVSDRLLTMKNGSAAFDPIANKCIVYRAKNAYVSIGFAGIAYIDNKPTDKWIVECISGSNLDDQWSIQSGPNASFNTYDYSIHRLANTLSAAQEVKKHGLQLSIVGWKLTNKRWYYFLEEITWKPGDLNFKRYVSPRPWRSAQKLFVSAIGAESEGLRVIKKKLHENRERNPRNLSVIDAETVLLSVVQEVSKTNRTVGQHALSVVLNSPAAPEGYCKFFPQAEHSLVLTPENFELILPSYHSPYVLSGNVIASPSAVVGGFQVDLEGVPFSVHGNEASDTSIKAAITSIRRPKSPAK